MPRTLTVLVLTVSALAGCATGGRPDADPAGSYQFEAWLGENVFRGTLHLVRSSTGELTGSIEVEGTPRAQAVRVDYQADGRLTFVAEGPSRLIRIVATISGRSIEGTWTNGSRSGVFRAARSVF